MLLKEGSSGKEVQRLQGALVKEGFDLDADGKFGIYTTAAVKAFQMRNELQPDGVCGPKTWEALGLGDPKAVKEEEAPAEAELPKPGEGLVVTATLLAQIAPGVNMGRAKALAEALTPVLITLVTPKKTFAIGINSPERLACFLAQAAHESDGFRTMHEYASGAAYEGRRDLGNIHPGDGRKYKGRGLFELTGLGNYDAFSKETGIDIVDNPKDPTDDKDPEKAETPVIAAQTAVWFWHNHNLNPLADKGDMRKITKIINGGYNGLDSRLIYWARAKGALGI